MYYKEVNVKIFLVYFLIGKYIMLEEWNEKLIMGR